MSVTVDLLPWRPGQDLQLEAIWRQSVRQSDNYRACLQFPDWVAYRWFPIAPVLLAILRDTHSNMPLSVTPLVESTCSLPLSIGSRSLTDMRMHSLLIVGNDPLFPASAENYWALCHAALNRTGIDCLYAGGIPSSSAFFSFLHSDYRHRFINYPIYKNSEYLFLRLTDSYDDYCRKFKPKMLKNLQRELRIFEKRKPLQFTRITHRDQVKSFLLDAEAIAGKSWQRHLVDLPLASKANRMQLLQACADNGTLRSYLLRSGDDPCAFVIGWQYNNLFYFHETAYDPALQEYSPGKCLLNMIIRDCFSFQSPATFHFGPGVAGYKKWFANGIGHEDTAIIARRSIRNLTKIGTHHAFRYSIALAKRAALPIRDRRRPDLS